MIYGIFIAMNKIWLVTVVTILIFIMQNNKVFAQEKATWWDIQSIDTMKLSRDLAREKASDPKYDIIIDNLLVGISSAGATHVAIATPYDEEFIPYMRRWVTYARKHKLHVWFRGNFSGWEQWFGYQKISKEEHLKLTSEFIRNHSDLFSEGDIFSSCPECENGALGDPRHNGRIEEYKQFLLDQYQVSTEAFKAINKKVPANYFSMNGDVARLIMDKEYTRKLGGIVVIDHYVKTPADLNEDINEYARISGGKVVLGEFGAPIPDINGDFSDSDQVTWMKETMQLLVGNENLVGVNYWTSVGSSTALWEDDFSEKPALSELKTYLIPSFAEIRFLNDLSHGIEDVRLVINGRPYKSDEKGVMEIKYFNHNSTTVASHSKYLDFQIDLEDVSTDLPNEVYLTKTDVTLLDKIIKIIFDIYLTITAKF